MIELPNLARSFALLRPEGLVMGHIQISEEGVGVDDTFTLLRRYG
jgi:hypothetical protein